MALRLSAVLDGDVQNEIALFGVEKSGWISYGVDGIVAGHNGVLHYLRACADEGAATVVYAVYATSDLAMFQRLLSLSGQMIRRVNLLVKREGPSFAPNAGAVYANLELTQAQVSMRQAVGDSGRNFHLVSFHANSGMGRFTFG